MKITITNQNNQQITITPFISFFISLLMKFNNFITKNKFLSKLFKIKPNLTTMKKTQETTQKDKRFIFPRSAFNSPMERAEYMGLPLINNNPHFNEKIRRT